MRLLQEIRNLQKTRLHYEEEQRNEADRENEINNDWMLAAAVVDRICAIVFTIVFIGGNLFFLILFFVIARPWLVIIVMKLGLNAGGGARNFHLGATAQGSSSEV